MEYFDVRDLQRFGECQQSLVFVGSCDQEQLVRMASEDALDRVSEFIKIMVDSGNDHCDVLGCKGGFGWYRNRLVRPMANSVSDETYVAVEPV